VGAGEEGKNGGGGGNTSDPQLIGNGMEKGRYTPAGKFVKCRVHSLNSSMHPSSIFLANAGGVAVGVLLNN
jgi:hypothetical protein